MMTPLIAITFSDVIDLLLELEGGVFTNLKSDRGGPTKWGVTVERMRDWRERHGYSPVSEVILVAMIDNLDRPLASDIWEGTLWADERKNLEHLPVKVARHIFQLMAVMGQTQAWREVQRTWNTLFSPPYSGPRPLVVDGICGVKTREALAGLNLADGETVHTFNNVLAAHAQGLFRVLVAQDPTQRENLAGWVNRAGAC